MGHKRAKQVDICTERKKETANNGLQHKKRQNEEIKNKYRKIVVIKLKMLNKKGDKRKSVTESSGLFPLALNPGTDAF
jgi:hypothetical protein